MKKLSTGIKGLDDILYGGLPQGKITFVLGRAGTGKTLLSTQFLYEGTLVGDTGLLISFDERVSDLIDHIQSDHHDIKSLILEQSLIVDHIYFDDNTHALDEHYTLDGLKLRLDTLIKKYAVKRIVLDSFKSLFQRFEDSFNYKVELTRLLHWLRDLNITTIITGGIDNDVLGIESYIADCVVLLDQRIHGQISTRRMRVLKYRGSDHECNEYPFSISSNGILVSPLSSLKFDHSASTKRISTGIQSLDAMFKNQGFYQGSSVLVSGEAGSGKSSMAAHFIHQACLDQKKALLFLFEESEAQIKRNMLSIGIDLQPFIDINLLKVHAVRPTEKGLEKHLLSMIHAIDTFHPKVVVIDPISAFWSKDTDLGIKALMTQIIDYLKRKQITGMYMHLMHTLDSLHNESTLISSLIDTWLVLRNREVKKYRTRDLFIVKSRGMAHDQAVRSFKITDKGIVIEKDEPRG